MLKVRNNVQPRARSAAMKLSPVAVLNDPDRQNGRDLVDEGLDIAGDKDAGPRLRVVGAGPGASLPPTLVRSYGDARWSRRASSKIRNTVQPFA